MKLVSKRDRQRRPPPPFLWNLLRAAVVLWKEATMETHTTMFRNQADVEINKIIYNESVNDSCCR